MKKKSPLIKITHIKYVKEYKLHIFYSDGTEKIVDFEPFLRNSQHSEIQKYLQLKNFKKFTVNNGELMWGDFDLIFPIMDIYKNKLV